MSEHENILQTVKTILQDVVAPDVREVKIRVEAQKDQIAGLESRMNVRFDALESRSESQYKAILAAIGQSKAENELMVLKQLVALTERVAALEATQHQN